MYNYITVVSETKGVELELNCTAINKEMFHLIKEMNADDKLFIVPKEKKVNRAEQMMEKSKRCEGVRFVRSFRQKKRLARQEYVVNTNQSIQMVWKSARMTMYLQRLRDSRLIGKNHELDYEIKIAEKLFAKLRNKYQQAHHKVVRCYQLINELKTKKAIVDNQWNKYQMNRQQIQSLTFEDEFLSMSQFHPEEGQRQKLLSFLMRKILEIDKKLLTQTFVFIFELNNQDCFVVLEDPYPPIKAKIKDIVNLIGEITYKEEIKDFFMSMEESDKKGLEFHYSNFKVCHKCLDIKIPEENEDFTCYSGDTKNDPTFTPFAFEKLIVRSDFTVIPEIYKNRKVPSENQYLRYCHPYLKTSTKKCGRYLCPECLLSYEKPKRDKNQNPGKGSEGKVENLKEEDQTADKESSEIKNQFTNVKSFRVRPSKCHKLNRCYFCQCVCDCDRCFLADSFNRFVAYYQSFGGDFIKDITPNLIFPTYENHRSEFTPTDHEELENNWQQIKEYMYSKEFQKLKVEVHINKEKKAYKQQNLRQQDKYYKPNLQEKMIPEIRQQKQDQKLIGERYFSLRDQIQKTQNLYQQSVNEDSQQDYRGKSYGEIMNEYILNNLKYKKSSCSQQFKSKEMQE